MYHFFVCTNPLGESFFGVEKSSPKTVQSVLVGRLTFDTPNSNKRVNSSKLLLDIVLFRPWPVSCYFVLADGGVVSVIAPRL